MHGHVHRGEVTAPPPWQVGRMSPVQIRPVGGAAGCLTMIAVSVVLSILLTVVLNLVL